MSDRSAHAPLHSVFVVVEAAAAVASSATLSVFRRISHKLRQRRQSIHLAALDDRLLADIGVTREEALKEAKKPLW